LTIVAHSIWAGEQAAGFAFYTRRGAQPLLEIVSRRQIPAGARLRRRPAAAG